MCNRLFRIVPDNVFLILGIFLLGLFFCLLCLTRFTHLTVHRKQRLHIRPELTEQSGIGLEKLR